MSGNLIPRINFVFRPFIETPLKDVKVVIFGVEPSAYDKDQPDGLAFSSMRSYEDWRETNANTLGFLRESMRSTGKLPKVASLRNWAKQGVLLWNFRPTVKLNHPMHHLGRGWEKLSQEILESVYLNNPDAVFVLPKTLKANYGDILPEDALRIYFVPPAYHDPDNTTVGILTKINVFLKSRGQDPINWEVK